MMKQKDIILIAIVVLFAGILSVIVSNFFFTTDENKSLSAEVVESIDSEFQNSEQKEGLEQRVFNNNAINPTKLIEIGNSNNKQPF